MKFLRNIMTAFPPRVSVLMTTYNGAKFIGESIDSILCQTFSDFEFIIVDDASTDNTPDLIAAYDNSRIRYDRLERNVGVVGARNHAIELARGTYIAPLDHDDLARPTRLARQAAWLDENPDVVMVSSEFRVLENGRLYSAYQPFLGTPREAVPFFLHLRNGIPYSSIMFRASSVERLGTVFREDYKYVDDFDLYHRLLPLGSIDWIPEPLTIYRVHSANTTRDNLDLMNIRAAGVLASAYLPIFGKASQNAAQLIGRHVVARIPVSDRSNLMEIGRLIEQLASYFLDKCSPNDPARDAVRLAAAQAWWRFVRGAARAGRPHLLPIYWQLPALAGRFRPTLTDTTTTFILGLLRCTRRR